MPAKRTYLFITLTLLVWALLASLVAGYYYRQYNNNLNQLNTNQNSMNKIESSYNTITDKYNSMQIEYGTLYGNYSNSIYMNISNYASLITSLGKLIDDLHGNYSDVFTQGDINQTYTQLLSNYTIMQKESNVSETDFGNILNEYYDLFSLSAFTELEQSVGQATTMNVSIFIDYGNATAQWNNETQVPVGYTLFSEMQKIASINYTYYASTEPGHIVIDSINNKTSYYVSYTEGYSWQWYYWSNNSKTWIIGPVGCDAWLLKNGDVYKWNFEHWTF